MPHRRDIRGRILFNSYLPYPLCGEWEAPEGLEGLIDLNDPDLEYIINAISWMRHVGMDVTTADTIRMAVDAGHRKAEEARATPVLESLEDARRRIHDDLERHENDVSGDPPCVYYARLGNRVKIGYTLNLAQRMSVFQPEEVLVTEPGGIVVEARRHKQFARLRVSGEWFRYEDELVEHVEAFRREAAAS